jgi:hypothetical protein
LGARLGRPYAAYPDMAARKFRTMRTVGADVAPGRVIAAMLTVGCAMSSYSDDEIKRLWKQYGDWADVYCERQGFQRPFVRLIGEAEGWINLRPNPIGGVTEGTVRAPKKRKPPAAT